MKRYLLLFFILVALDVLAQDKHNYVHYNKLAEVKGTDFVIATIENLGKMYTVNSKYLLFIDTKSGQTKQIDFHKDAHIRNVEQVKLDTLGINVVLVVGSTKNLDGDKTIGWNEPSQILIFSTDGQERVQLTEDNYILSTWAINRNTGTLVTTGHYDTNKNGKFDKTDRNGILIYDLKTKKLITRI